MVTPDAATDAQCFFSAVLYGNDPRPRTPDPCDRVPPAAVRGRPRVRLLKLTISITRRAVFMYRRLLHLDPREDRGATEMLYSRTRCTTPLVRLAACWTRSAASGARCLPRTHSSISPAHSRTLAIGFVVFSVAVSPFLFHLVRVHANISVDGFPRTLTTQHFYRAIEQKHWRRRKFGRCLCFQLQVRLHVFHHYNGSQT